MPFLGSIAGILGNTFVQYGLIALVAFGGLAWLRADAAAPYKAEIVQLRKASQQKDAIIEADAAQKLADLEEKTGLENKLREFINATDTDSACRLSADELSRLRKL